MKVLIIGGTRFIGPYVVEQLLKSGHEIALFHRGNHKVKAANVQNIFGHRSNLVEYKDDFKTFNPDVVLDMFPFTQKDAQELIETFSPLTGRIVALSSGDVYQAFGRIIGTEKTPVDSQIITELSPLRENLFPLRNKVKGREDFDKILVEKELIETKLIDSTILRLPMVYGPGDYQHRMYKYIKRINDKRPYIILDESFGNWKWTKGYVENIAAGIVLSVEKECNGNRIYNIGEQYTITMKQWIEDIGKAMGWNGKVINVQKEKLPESMQEKDNTSQLMVVDSSLIRNELGFEEIIPYSTGLIKTIEWESHNPPDSVESDFNYHEEDRLIKLITV